MHGRERLELALVLERVEDLPPAGVPAIGAPPAAPGSGHRAADRVAQGAILVLRHEAGEPGTVAMASV